MKLVVLCLRFTSYLALLSPGLAFNQTQPVESDQAAAAPVAYVYVSQSPVNPGPNQVLGFAAAANGKLQPIQGSPFAADINLMAVTGKYLIGGSTDQLYLNTYTVEKDGAITFAVANDILQMTGYNYGANISMALDHSGATVYVLRILADGSNNAYEGFNLDKATGALSLTPDSSFDNAGNDDAAAGDFTISANDKYFYAVASGWAAYSIWNWNRASDGALLQPSASPLIPLPESESGDRFDPVGISADPANHVAVAFMNTECCGVVNPEAGPEQLAVYTADSKGNLTTTGTYKTMPKVAVGHVSLKMSPSGKLLAAYGDNGLQIFHFNGAHPITPYATLVQGVDFEQAYWDGSNHLYAVSQKTGMLYVFTVKASSIVPAPGSPYSIPGAQNIVVHSL